MAATRRWLTVYRVRDTVDGAPATRLDAALSGEALADPRMSVHDLDGRYDFAARLYVLTPDEREPAWADLLREGFPTLDLRRTTLHRAVLVVATTYRGSDHVYAFTFGGGRHLLRPGAIERDYGRRFALNVIYDRSDPARALSPARIRQVDAKTVAANTLRTRRQANRDAAFEVFGLDAERDLLGSVTGVPARADRWGTRVTGGDALRIQPVATVQDLGALCRRIHVAHRREDYQDGFRWIDDLQAVGDPERVSALEAAVADRLARGEVDGFDLAPPELVDWDRIASFRFSFEAEREHDDLDLAAFVGALERKGKLRGMTVDRLKRRYRVLALDADGDVLGDWPVFRCLDGEVRRGRRTYLLVEGDFYEVSTAFLTELDRAISALPETSTLLPDSPGDLSEGRYNELAADCSPDHLLLDRRTVRVSTSTSPIELCDVLTRDGAFVHVKRKLGSSSLSHLFAQGAVSADLFLRSAEFRRAARTVVQAAEAERGAAAGRFARFDDDRVIPGDWEVVYAIVARWNGRTLAQALPFFSKVNLRRHAQDLRRMGYRVSHKRIAVT